VKTNTLWDTVDKLTDFRAKVQSDVKCITLTTGEVTNDKDLISDALADSFVVYKEINNDMVTQERNQRIEAYCDLATTENRPNNFTISDNQVFDAIRTLSKKSSSNNDSIPTKVIKAFSSQFALLLATFFTQIFNKCEIPKAMRSALVTPLYKGKGPRNNVDSFRPISVLSPITKFFEILLFSIIRKFIEPFLCEQQHGFRQLRSCHTALSLLRIFFLPWIRGMGKRVLFLLI